MIHNILIELTDAEWKTIEREARNLNISVTDFIQQNLKRHIYLRWGGT